MKPAFTFLIAMLAALAASPSSFAADNAPPTMAGIQYKGIGIDFGGFAALESVYRNNNMESDIGESYTSIPFQNNAGYGMSEFRESARQSRFSILAKSNVDDTTHLTGYYEFDFLSAAPTANSKESNSYNIRMRNLYVAADWEDLGWHLLAGQNWSLVTMNTKGITPRNEQLPPTIDSQYAVGFNWARQPQVRITKDWAKTFWLALSVENAQTGTVSGVVPAGFINTNQLAGGSLFSSTNTLSFNGYPDLVAKFAWEAADIGHFEVFDVMRNFQSRYGQGIGTVLNSSTKQSTWANSVGGGISVPMFWHKLDVTVSGLYGAGARYGTAQLPDATYSADGSLNPLTAVQYLAQLTWHSMPTLDIYATFGQEKDLSASGNNGAAYGYGDSVAANNLGCSFLGGTCSPQFKRAQQENVGVWWSFYKGSYGLAKLGGQYSHTDLNTYADAGGVAPSTKEDMAYASIRFYPF